MSRWWAAPYRCGSAMLALLALHGSAALHAESQDEAWLKRSREILEKAGEQAAPDWLRREATQEALAAAEEVAAQSVPKAGVPPANAPSSASRVLIFGSLSIPETTLRALLEEATQPDVSFVLRGVPKGGTIKDAGLLLKRLNPATGVVPNVILDPTLFRRHGVSTVPTLVLERDGKKPVRVVGAMTIDWLRRQAATVAAGQEDLGSRAESYAIAEADFVVEMQERMARIDWNERRRAAIDRFWSRPRNFVELPDAPAAREFLVDPSVRVTEDLEDADGTVLVHAGETFNPLDWVPLSKTIIVFRGTDARHVKAAAEAARRARTDGRGVILLTTAVDTTRGWEHLNDMERELVGAVYLMPASLVERFHLTHIPATIASRGKQLLVKELAVRPAS